MQEDGRNRNSNAWRHSDCRNSCDITALPSVRRSKELRVTFCGRVVICDGGRGAVKTSPHSYKSRFVLTRIPTSILSTTPASHLTTYAQRSDALKRCAYKDFLSSFSKKKKMWLVYQHLDLALGGRDACAVPRLPFSLPVWIQPPYFSHCSD